MTIPMTPKQRKPISRSVNVLAPLDANGKNGIIRITVANKHDDYIVDRVPTDFAGADAFSLEKWEGTEKETRYMVCLSGSQSKCDCLGHGYTGSCKHTDALLALRKAGKLTTSTLATPTDAIAGALASTVAANARAARQPKPSSADLDGW